MEKSQEKISWFSRCGQILHLQVRGPLEKLWHISVEQVSHILFKSSKRSSSFFIWPGTVWAVDGKKFLVDLNFIVLSYFARLCLLFSILLWCHFIHTEAFPTPSTPHNITSIISIFLINKRTSIRKRNITRSIKNNK